MHLRPSWLGALSLFTAFAIAPGVLVVLAGCAASPNVPVVERKQPPSKKINHHWVAEGETLYAIAWRYNLDVERLARVNRMSLNERIYVGQKLRLDVNSPVVSAPKRAAKTDYGRSKKQQRSSDSVLNSRIASNWHWPTKGSITRRFSFSGNSGHKGIDIKARGGQAVHATQEGVVVYAGSGLPAYGNLLIVKHAENYLSAYAHNSKLMVGEGSRVSIGQKIAEVGKSGTTHEHLYFEIRKRGVPVNPMSLLRS